ncbi:RNA polymerase subunit sigma-70, partial [Clostridium sp. CCUG 7971]|nr:RNA polymerase subunit sigma-70 [Clostridium sp. CCUG 7971]
TWGNIKSFDKNKNNFKNWICAISKYKAIDYKRKYLSKIETLDISE